MMLRLCLCLSLVLMAGIEPAAARDPELIEIQTPGYRVISSQGKAAGLHYLQQMERFQQALETALNKHVAPSALQTRIYVLSPEDFKAFFRPYPDISGFFAPAEFVNYLAVDGGEDRRTAMRGSFHEYAHYFLSTQYAGTRHPAWFHEGFAQVMEGVTFSRHSATFGLPVGRILQLREIDWLPFSRVLDIDMDSSQYSERDMLPAFYGQSWALVHYAMNTEGVWPKLTQFLHATDRGQPVEEALREKMGVSAGELEKLLKEYINRKSLSTLLVDLPPQRQPEVESVRVLGTEEGALELAEATLRLMFLKQSNNADRVQPLLDRVAASSALHPRALALRALMAGAQDDTAQADEWIAQASAAMAPTDAATAKIMGYVLLYRVLWMGVSARTPAGEVGDWLKRSRGFYETALKAQPDDLEAIWGFGMSSAWANIEVAKAVELLKAAFAREPRSDFLALALAYGSDQLGDKAAVESYWKKTEMYARHDTVRNLARKTLGKMQQPAQGLPASGASRPLE